MQEVRNTVTEMKNVFDGLISRLDTAKERISELEHISKENSKTEKQKDKKKSQNRISKDCGTTIKAVHVMRISEEEKEKTNRKKYMK